jgi:hypothetical protein
VELRKREEAQLMTVFERCVTRACRYATRHAHARRLLSVEWTPTRMARWVHATSTPRCGPLATLLAKMKFQLCSGRWTTIQKATSLPRIFTLRTTGSERAPSRTNREHGFGAPRHNAARH